MSRSDDTPSIERWDHPVSIRMVVIDIDHTLITDDHRLTEHTVRSVRAARQRGVEVVLASSRPPLGMLHYLRTLGLSSPECFIASQGGLIGEWTGEPGEAGQGEQGASVRILHSTPIPRRLAQEVAVAGERAGLSVNWYAGTGWFVPHRDARVDREATVVGVDPMETDLHALARDPEKILLLAPPSVGVDDLREIPLPAGVEATVSNSGYLEVTASGVGKGSAVRIVANGAGVPLAQVMAIGDGENDLGMFAAAGVGVAVANASARVRRQADFVTRSNGDDGVALALDFIAQASVEKATIGLQREK